MSANSARQYGFYEKGQTSMFLKCFKYATAILMTVLLSLLLFGCGGGSGAATTGPTATPGPTPTPTGGFTVTGKISLADGTPIIGATVSLHQTSYTIYSTASANGHLYGTVNSNGEEGVSVDMAALQSKSTDTNGVYLFTGVPGGSYTIQPASNLYVFKWVLVPTLGTIGVITITDSGTVYTYNPEGSGNTLAYDSTNTIIYNTVAPFAITNSTLNGQDFEASLPGGTGL
jgi:hypothetical protein